MKDAAIQTVGHLHRRLVFGRRIRVLAAALVDHIPRNATIADIGCGSGLLGARLRELRPDILPVGFEIQVRSGSMLPCAQFDGTHLPLPPRSVDICLFVDVLHHAADAGQLLQQAAQACRRGIIIKDHVCRSRWDHTTLRFMDWVGNRAHGVGREGLYLSEGHWRKRFLAAGLDVSEWRSRVGLYPFPFSLLFERHLHFTALVEPIRKARSSAPSDVPAP